MRPTHPAGTNPAHIHLRGVRLSGSTRWPSVAGIDLPCTFGPVFRQARGYNPLWRPCAAVPDLVPSSPVLSCLRRGHLRVRGECPGRSAARRDTALKRPWPGRVTTFSSRRCRFRSSARGMCRVVRRRSARCRYTRRCFSPLRSTSAGGSGCLLHSLPLMSPPLPSPACFAAGTAGIVRPVRRSATGGPSCVRSTLPGATAAGGSAGR